MRIINKLVKHGHKEDDVKYKYSIPQVFTYYEDIMKMEMEEQRINSIIIANCVAYAQPAWSKKDSVEKERQWKKFLESLEPETLEKQEEKRRDPLKSLVGLVPMFNAPTDLQKQLKGVENK